MGRLDQKRHNNKQRTHLMTLVTFTSLVIGVSWILLHRTLNNDRYRNSFTVRTWPPQPVVVVRANAKHNNRFRYPASSIPSYPHPSSTWFARPGETFSEGAFDTQRLHALKKKSKSIPRFVSLSSIHYLLARGDVAQKLGLRNIRFLLSTTVPMVQKSPHFVSQNGVYHLAKSKKKGDPYWYLTKNNIVNNDGQGKAVNILAYQQPSPQLSGAVATVGSTALDPWQKNSHYDFWTKNRGSWQLAGEEGLFFVPVLIKPGV